MPRLAKTLLDTFYFLKKEYGTVIRYTKVGKGNIDPDTGIRDNSADITFSIDAVIAPVGTMTDFLMRVLGRVDVIETVYLVRHIDIPCGITIEDGDFFVHGNVKYRELGIEDFDGVLLALTGKSFK